MDGGDGGDAAGVDGGFGDGGGSGAAHDIRVAAAGPPNSAMIGPGGEVTIFGLGEPGEEGRAAVTSDPGFADLPAILPKPPRTEPGAPDDGAEA